MVTVLISHVGATAVVLTYLNAILTFSLPASALRSTVLSTNVQLAPSGMLAIVASAQFVPS